MENIDIDGVPFSIMMDRAVKLKQLQTKDERLQYDSYPSFYANTIFPHENVLAARSLSTFNEQLNAAEQMKEEGNAASREGCLQDALNKYEMALSVFRYLQNTNPHWKSDGIIRDDNIVEIEHECKDDQERQQLNKFLVNCYNNIAIVSSKMKDYSLAVKASDFAIAIDECNDKAYYLRAKARLAPKSSGGVEQELAKADLLLILKHNPKNADGKRLLEKLNNQIKMQKLKDKSTFKGLFDRGEIYNECELAQEKKATKTDEQQSKERDIILGRQLAQLYEEKGMDTEKERLESSIKYEMNIMEKEQKAKMDTMDFRNPSEDMIRDAKAMGVDLKDPQTIVMLEGMKKDKSKGFKDEVLPSVKDDVLVPSDGNQAHPSQAFLHCVTTYMQVIAVLASFLASFLC